MGPHLHCTLGSCVTDGQSLSCISKVLKILAKLQQYLISGRSTHLEEDEEDDTYHHVTVEWS